MILVVDDDADIRETVSIAIEAAGHEVASVAGGWEALGWIDAHGAPSMVLLDMRMPGMNGEEFLRELKSRRSLDAVPVVVMSGDPFSQERARELAASGCLQKPVMLRDLEAIVDRFASTSQRAPSLR
jgi:CheY-like chemotaxis protein